MSDLRQIIICSLEEWDDVWRRNQFLADRLLRRNPDLQILFVEPAADPLYDLSVRRRPQGPRLRTFRDGRLRTLRPLKPLPRRAGPVADVVLRTQVRTAARVLGFDHPILWLNDVTYAPLIRRTGWPTLYDVTDDLSLFPSSRRERERQKRLDTLALQDAAEVVVCSPVLARSRGERRAVSLIPNAVDAEHFRRPRERPADLPPGPVVVYVGTLHEARVDVELVLELAAALESLPIALVGPDSLSSPVRASLAATANVHLLGPRPYEDVPAYFQHADVVVVPHRVSPFIESADPIKAYECLAARRPTVATPTAGFRELGEQIALAPREEFVDRVRDTLADSAPVTPMADVPGWEERTEAFAAALRRLQSRTTSIVLSPGCNNDSGSEPDRR